jgi:hypothetical protein
MPESECPHRARAVQAALPVQRADVFASAPPTSLATLRATPPLLPSRRKYTGSDTPIHHIQVETTPFARGSFRLAYRAWTAADAGGAWRPCVLKRFIKPERRTRARYAEQIEADNCAAYLGQQWMREVVGAEGEIHRVGPNFGATLRL